MSADTLPLAREADEPALSRLPRGERPAAHIEAAGHPRLWLDPVQTCALALVAASPFWGAVAWFVWRAIR